ncbi:uncharacterized protein Dwil_GK27331 [Drosophila willistoni]|uniref:Essential MCU regulator, mitochondrial n=1 Tax=Drosophila willistoni TaxID=7260 RepID=A0A0Q9WYZ0_DROWI|nr:uncharacterized protein Dwil_GK27331 [Drosophila willistoni]
MWKSLLTKQSPSAAHCFRVPRHLREAYTRYGGFRPRPKRDKYSRRGLALTVIPGILLGGFIAKKIAYFLEISELFTPDDMDDDDEE